MKKLILIFLLFPLLASAQIGGRHVFDFLNLSPSARIGALGSVNVSTMDDDPNFAYQNPALLNDSMHQRVSFSVVNYLADITYGYVSYAHHVEDVGTFHAGIQYVGYGEFTQADEFGNITGSYSAGDMAIVLGAARSFGRFHTGANLKFVNSSIAGFNSFGMALDFGGSYLSRDKLFSAGVVAQNLGSQLSKYTPTGEREPLPFQLLAGVSYKLKYMPMRFSVTLTNLETPRLIYEDPNPVPQFDLSGNLIEPPKQIGDKIFRHFVFGTEFLIGKNIRLRGGYNHMRREELRSEGAAGLSGFSLGLGVRIYRFRFDYGFTSFHAVGGTHQFSISSPIQKWKKKGE